LRRLSWGGLGIIAVLIVGFLALKNTSFVQNTPALSRLASISLEDRTTQSRFLIWKMALQGAKERPVFGWGQENFNFVFNEHYNPEMYSQEQWFDRAHNEFLDWLIAGGVPASLLYLSLFALAAWAIWRSREISVPQQAALIGLLAGYGFNNMFVFDNLMSIAYFFLVLAFAHSLSWKKLPNKMVFLKPGSDQMVAIAAPIVAILVLVGGWMLNASGIARAQTLIMALQGSDPATGAAITDEQHFAYFKTAVSQGELGKQEAVEQLFQFASNTIAPSTSVSPQTKQDVYAYTLQTGNELLAQRPNDARLELFMSVFLSQFGQTDQALEYLQKAQALSPEKQQILFQIGNLYLQEGDAQNAIATFKKAYDLEPAYDTARILYAGSLYYAGRGAEADALLTEKFGTVLFDNDQLLQIYQNTKQSGRVIAIWEARAKKSPSDYNTMLGLASIYFQYGDTAKTIETLQTVIRLNPSMAGQVQQIITQIQDGTLKPPAQ
jgi:tetratricopeptide (TPR) repeat protein